MEWTLDNGTLVSRAYVRRRAVSYLLRWRSTHSRQLRVAAIVATVDSDEWMRRRNGETVGSICRGAEDYLLQHTPSVLPPRQTAEQDVAYQR